MPMPLVRRKPDYVSGPNFFDRASPTLSTSTAGRHDQGLPQRMRVPRCSSTRLERDAGAANTCRFGSLEQRVNANCAGEPISWPFTGTLRPRPFYLHLLNVVLSSLVSTFNPQPPTLNGSTSFYLHLRLPSPLSPLPSSIFHLLSARRS